MEGYKFLGRLVLIVSLSTGALTLGHTLAEILIW